MYTYVYMYIYNMVSITLKCIKKRLEKKQAKILEDVIFE